MEHAARIRWQRVFWRMDVIMRTSQTHMVFLCFRKEGREGGRKRKIVFSKVGTGGTSSGVPAAVSLQ